MTSQRLCKFQLRLTQLEKVKAEQLADDLGITLSDVFRSVIYKKFLVFHIPDVNIRTYLKLGKISNNINQITKVLNTHNKFNANVPYDVIFELKEQLANVSTQIDQIREQMDYDCQAD
ncbi:MobC family plasmid mobilization relaxosome protein [Gloeothece verrucosa]|uniref:Mobilization protein n=1 Tax=Gloeothece verrucosa (strain PCC 7822) TaxID=497965 RepID=E0UNH0_GLOV7|nr:MobC family plasmid mobilization relaxosome protein [Gloeothece verrucosa]ADN18500.1 mobilization protein [Gloeothece verrucosa PCC 7822]